MKVSMKPVTTVFDIEWRPDDYDPSDGADPQVTIRQATTGDNNMIMDLFSKEEVNYGDGGTSVTRNWNFGYVVRERAWCTLADWNFADEEDKPLLKFKDGRIASSRAQFDKVWANLPQGLTREIHECILRVNPQWDPDELGE